VVRSYLIVIGDVLRRRVKLHWLAFEEHLLKSDSGLTGIHNQIVPYCWITSSCEAFVRSSNRVSTFGTIARPESRRVGSRQSTELGFEIARPFRRVSEV
jgi:hypothetical protein